MQFMLKKENYFIISILYLGHQPLKLRLLWVSACFLQCSFGFFYEAYMLFHFESLCTRFSKFDDATFQTPKELFQQVEITLLRSSQSFYVGILQSRFIVFELEYLQFFNLQFVLKISTRQVPFFIKFCWYFPSDSSTIPSGSFMITVLRVIHSTLISLKLHVRGT